MSLHSHVDNYLQGLAANDPALFLPAMADRYIMDDPNSAVIPKAAMVDYMNGLAGFVVGIRGANSSLPLLEISERVEREVGGELTTWVWWHVPGTPLQGAGLIKSGVDGVRSEKLTYYAKIAG